MALVLTQEGGLQLWKYLLGISPAIIPAVHLFGAAHSPAHTDTESTYAAIELAGGGGYAPISLSGPTVNWTLGKIPAGAQATYISISWTFTGTQNIFGYWLSDPANMYSLWAEAFAAEYQFPANGGVFTLVLPPTLTSQP